MNLVKINDQLVINLDRMTHAEWDGERLLVFVDATTRRQGMDQQVCVLLKGDDARGFWNLLDIDVGWQLS